MPAKQSQQDRGAAAVEFALIASLVLIPLLLGMMEFGWAFFHKGVLANAAREAARVAAITDDEASAKAAAIAAGAPAGIVLTPDAVVVTTVPCESPSNVKVVIRYTHQPFTGFFGSSIVLEGTGTMRCEG